MDNPAKNPTSLTRTRGETAVIIGFLMAGAVGLSYVMSSTTESSERQDAAESAYIEKNSCVVAQMNGRYVAKYRCEKPEPRYLERSELARLALEGAEPR